MQKSSELLDIREVGAHFGLSESSIRRRIKATRNGTSNFPLPLFSSGSRVLFRKADILSWAGEEADVITFTPSPVPQVTMPQSNTQVRKGLEALGIRLPVDPTTNPAPMIPRMQQDCKVQKKK